MSSVSIDREQVADLFVSHRDDIVDFLLQRVRCPHAAQDLSQETYLRMLRKDQVPHADNLVGYLYRTAERLAIDFLRYDQRISGKHDELSDDLVCPRTQPDTLIQLRQQCERLLDAIAALSVECRNVLLLRKIDELSYAEIAARLGISEKTVQRHLVKAMLHCQRRFERLDATA